MHTLFHTTEHTGHGANAEYAGVDALHVTVLTDRCAGCEECVVRCPTEALTIDPDRWVVIADDAACVGCRQCTRTCPFSAITVTGAPLVAPRVATHHDHPAEVRGDGHELEHGFERLEEALVEARRCLDCPDPTCVRGCPAHNDIPSFVNALAAGEMHEAAGVLRRTTMLPDVCSRVCNQAAQCEGACTWSLAGERPVAIGALERFVAEHAGVEPPRVPETPAGLSVGVVGAGPAGIAAAWELAEAGVEVTVYERDPEPGGLLESGIPDFTLPEAVASRPWRQLQAAGVTLITGHEVTPEEAERLLVDHDGLILAVGATVPLAARAKGADLAGVVTATEFLRDGKAVLEHGEAADEMLGRLGHREGLVLVLGGGNTALDVARTARRLGLEALCVDWVAEAFALARPDELAEARAEGVEVRFLRTLLELRDDGAGHVGRAVLACTSQERRERRPEVHNEQTEKLDVGLVVVAMGYHNDPTFAPYVPEAPLARRAHGVPDRRWQASGVLASPVGRSALGREVGLTASATPHRTRVWVAGDALIGPSTVVEAMAQGRRAALALLAAHRMPGASRT